MSDSHTMLSRAFVALWPDHADAERLQRATLHCCPDRDASMLDPRDLHCTLAYVGDLAVHEVASLEVAFGRIGAAGFEMSLDVVEQWPGPRVLVALPRSTPAEVVDLCRAVNAAVAGMGRAVDARPYRAHVTLRRRVSRPCPPTPIDSCTWRLSAFALACAGDAGGPLRYRIHRRWRLTAAANR